MKGTIIYLHFLFNSKLKMKEIARSVPLSYVNVGWIRIESNVTHISSIVSNDLEVYWLHRD